MEAERLRDDGGGSAGVELVGEPCAVEGVGGRFGASAVNEERSICKKRKIKNRGNEFSSSLSDLRWKDREREREAY